MNSTSNHPNPTQEPASPPRSSYRWAVVGMLWFICFFNYADRVAISSVFPLLEKQFHFTKTQLGEIGAAFTWVYAAASPLAGHVGDRYQRKRVILSGLYVWSIITGLTSYCASVIQFLLVRGSEGLGETFYMPASMAIISDYHTPATRSRAIGLHQTSIYAGTIGGAALAGWMAERYGWPAPFKALAIAGVLLGLILHTFIREPRRNEAERRERGDLFPVTESSGSLSKPDLEEPLPLHRFLIDFARNRTAILLVAAFFGANSVGLVFLTWMPTFLKEKFGLNLALAGLGATFFIQVASMCGAMLGGVTADRWSRKRAEGRVWVQALATLCGAPFIFLCGFTRNPLLLIIAMTLFGLSKGVYDSNLTAAFYDVVPASRRSSATGIMNLVGWIGAGLGSVAIGYAVDHHVTMSNAISSTAVVYVIVAIILYYTATATLRQDMLKVQS